MNAITNNMDTSYREESAKDKRNEKDATLDDSVPVEVGPFIVLWFLLS